MQGPRGHPRGLRRRAVVVQVQVQHRLRPQGGRTYWYHLQEQQDWPDQPLPLPLLRGRPDRCLQDLPQGRPRLRRQQQLGFPG